MSRVGREPISLPAGVTATLDGSRIEVSGPNGVLTRLLHPDMQVTIGDGRVQVTRPSEQRKHRALHGLTRTLINNMVIGVVQGFTKTLEIQGTGYRAQMEEATLVLRVGFSHDVHVEPLEGITFELEGPLVHVRGIDKQVVGQQAATIRRVRPPEPYKGKGIRYQGEWVRRKAGKGARTALGA